MADELNKARWRARVARRIHWAISLRWVLLLLIGMTLTFTIVRPGARTAWLGPAVLTGVLIVWLPSLLRGRQQRQLITMSGEFLAQGRLDAAEASLTQALERFTLATAPQVVACHYMAVLAHARQQFDEAVGWCRAVLRYAQRTAGGMLRSCRLLLADSLINLDCLAEAHEALKPLYSQSLSLTERLMLLPIQLRYELACGHYESALHDLPGRVQMAGLLETKPSARVQAMLAVACRRQGRRDEADFLWQRVEALGEEEITREYAPQMEAAGCESQQA
jgi:hypothetical protein